MSRTPIQAGRRVGLPLRAGAGWRAGGRTRRDARECNRRPFYQPGARPILDAPAGRPRRAVVVILDAPKPLARGGSDKRPRLSAAPASPALQRAPPPPKRKNRERWGGRPARGGGQGLARGGGPPAPLLRNLGH